MTQSLGLRPSLAQRPLLPAAGVLPKLIVFALLFAVTSRGVLELAIGKQGAYVAQTVCAVALIIVLRRLSQSRGRPRWGNYVAVYLIVLSGIASMAITVERWSLESLQTPLLYVLTFTLIALLLCWGSDRNWTNANLEAVAPAAAVLTVLQVGAAVGQQYLGFNVLGGSDFNSLDGQVRPSGLTGSYLHYPLVIAVLGIALFGAWVRTRSRVALICAGFAVAAVLISYSRSGMLILAATVVVGVLTNRTLATKVVTAVAVAFVAVIGFLLFSTSPILARAMSAFDLGSAGNTGRVEQWTTGIESWLDSTLLFGSYTGLFGNISRNFGGVSFGVVESSLLQQLLNLGLLGAIATYWLLASVVRAVPRSDVWVRAGAIACVLQTLIYQSIEVLPFVTLVASLPLAFGTQDSVAAPNTDMNAEARRAEHA